MDVKEIEKIFHIELSYENETYFVENFTKEYFKKIFPHIHDNEEFLIYKSYNENATLDDFFNYLSNYYNEKIKKQNILLIFMHQSIKQY